MRRGRKGRKGREIERKTDLLPPSLLDIDIVVEINRGLLSGVEQVGDGLVLDHEAVVVAVVGVQEDGFASVVEAGDVPDDLAEAGGGEGFDVVAVGVIVGRCHCEWGAREE